MLQASWYLLKVILCSGILMGYYWLMLRNKIYHHYNRFFLLASTVLSLTLPLLTIHITHDMDLPQSQAIQLLQAVNSDTFFNEIAIKQNPNHFTIGPFLTVIYALVSLVMLVLFIRVLWIVRSLIYKYKGQIVERFFFVNTNAKGTPFSFFNYIFWNEAIDLESQAGRQIFRHEVAHVQERHSHDKIFINLLLIVFWCNPFFWLIRKELNMIHEFIADKKAVEDNDTASFAAMILQAAYPKHRFELTNNFFYSPIKRRLLMLTKNQNPKVSYISRMMVLPLAALVFAAFTFKAKPIYSKQGHADKVLQPITVVLDAGHGGKDAGSYGPNGEVEKDLTLALAQKIKSLNSSSSINWVLTRSEDVYLSPMERVNLGKAQKADLFISIHMDAAPKNEESKTGLTVYVAKAGYPNTESSLLLASGMVNAFANNYSLSVSPSPTQRQIGIAVLQNNECPSVLIEAGYMTNEKDLAYLKSEAGQAAIAQNILAAINNYQSQKSNGTQSAENTPKEAISVKQTMPNANVQQLAASNAVNDLDSLSPSTQPTIVVRQLKGSLSNLNSEKGAGESKLVKGEPLLSLTSKLDPLYVLNGTVLGNDDATLKKIITADILSVTVLKDAQAIKLYGDKGRNGVIEITTKKQGEAFTKGEKPAPILTGGRLITTITSPTQSEPTVIFTQGDAEAMFPGGDPAWRKFLEKNLDPTIARKAGWKKGIYKVILQFTVDAEGNVSEAKTLNYQNTKVSQHCIDVIKNGPNWEPATQNGRKIKAYRKQPITFVIKED